MSGCWAGYGYVIIRKEGVGSSRQKLPLPKAKTAPEPLGSRK